MCGIAGFIIKQRTQKSVIDLVLKMSDAMKHRGPDGEGLVAFSTTSAKPFLTADSPAFKNKFFPYTPQENYKNADENVFAAFAHRRLSIIDLTEAAHQPMCNTVDDIWITYNGEIYNYLELRDELVAVGYKFISESDTEVVIKAYKQWGTDCVNKFNGMWAFCIYDQIKKQFFASRDRFGVKPFYFINDTSYFAFASEQKAFIKSDLLKTSFSSKAAHHYLLNDEIENEPANFFEGITELWPGENLVFNSQDNSIQISTHYAIQDHVNLSNEHLNDSELTELIKERIYTAIQLRLRSDVEVGVCLSGGIDSSVIAGIMAQSTKKQIHCFTTIFKNKSFNEEHFADLVASKINGKIFKTEPTQKEFETDIEQLVYALDAPIWNSSTYAQFSVMRLAKEHHIKVVLDGQGADELFAGYHHHFIAFWDQTIREKGMLAGLKEIASSSKSIANSLQFYLKQKIKQTFPMLTQSHADLLKPDFVNAHTLINDNRFATNLNQQLIQDIGSRRLKSFLRCEDRCSMWHSVESRTPFSDDVGLTELLFSFNGRRKIQNGISKYYLREACKEILPFEIYTRYNKIGFETPMKLWVNSLEATLFENIEQANFEFIDFNHFRNNYDSRLPNHIKLLFKLFVLAKWQKVFSKNGPWEN